MCRRVLLSLVCGDLGKSRVNVSVYKTTDQQTAERPVKLEEFVGSWERGEGGQAKKTTTKTEEN